VTGGYEQESDWGPTVQLRWFDGVLQQKWRRVRVEWRTTNGGKDLQHQMTDEEWRDIEITKNDVTPSALREPLNTALDKLSMALGNPCLQLGERDTFESALVDEARRRIEETAK
jgi:hypothetical protein